MKIVIIGGGLGGFAVGISLLQNGFNDVTIYERDEGMNIRRQGYGLTILQGINALKKFHVFDEEFNGITKSRQITFANGLTITDVDFVIGADGINGLVRSFKYSLNEDLPLNYLGMLVALGVTGEIEHFLMRDRVFQTMDGSFRLFAMPFSKSREDQSIMCWQLSFPYSLELANQLSKDQQMLKDYILKQCHDWHSPIPQMISKTQLDFLMGIPAFDRDLFSLQDSSKEFLPIALIGDAAHPMSPFKGQGANQALLDALHLTEILKNNPEKDLHLLVNEYEQQMLNRVQSKVMQSRERVTTFHRPQALSTDNFLYRGVNQQLS